MSSLNLRLPESLHNQVRELAKRDNVSINQFITLAVAEKVSALLTLETLRDRASRGDRAQFERILDDIARKGRSPLPHDQLPEGEKISAEYTDMAAMVREQADDPYATDESPQ